MKVPKYQLIQNDLRQQIISGKFESGDKFYTEAELTKLYNVSSITVIRAVNELVKDGYLYRQQGKGTFISRSRKGKLVEFSDIEVFPDDKYAAQVLSCEKGNEPAILEKLALDKQDSYYKVTRLRRTGDQICATRLSYIPERYLLTPDAPLEHFQSISQRFKLDFNIYLSDEPYTETTEILFPAPDTIAGILQLKETQPLVLQEKLTYVEGSDEILAYTETYKIWNFFKFEIKANK
ncbi:GntR family transcriptional regulator [Streptococcus sp. 20-1249]|uniref:GntR family transcriptional regulator n=1 Tax=Streptococcus hepaticus TaxID=3349163 RepID=UPI00374A28B8